MSRTVTLRPWQKAALGVKAVVARAAELNRVSGVKKISAATVEQLDRRLGKAEPWLRQASARRVAD